MPFNCNFCCSYFDIYHSGLAWPALFFVTVYIVKISTVVPSLCIEIITSLLFNSNRIIVQKKVLFGWKVDYWMKHIFFTLHTWIAFILESPRKCRAAKKNYLNFKCCASWPSYALCALVMRGKVIVFSPPELTYDVSKFTWFLTPPLTVAVFKFDQFLTLPSLKNADVLNGQSHVSFDTDWKLARIIF